MTALEGGEGQRNIIDVSLEKCPANCVQECIILLLIQVHRGNSLRIALKHDYTSFTGYSSRGLVCAAVFMSLCHFIVVFIWVFV